MVVSPGFPPLPLAPTHWQGQFGMWITPQTAAAMDKTLPVDFVPPRGMEQTLRTIGRQAKVYVIVNRRGISRAGGNPDAPVSVRVAGIKIGDALLAVAAAQNPPLACMADDDDVAVTVTTPHDATLFKSNSSH